MDPTRRQQNFLAKSCFGNLSGSHDSSDEEDELDSIANNTYYGDVDPNEPMEDDVDPKKRIAELEDENARLRKEIEQLKYQIERLMKEKETPNPMKRNLSQSTPTRLSKKNVYIPPGTPQAVLTNHFPLIYKDTVVRLTCCDPNNPLLPYEPAITSEDLAGLSNLLKDNSMAATELNLRNNNIGETEVKVLLAGLEKNTLLEVLDLGSNKLGNEGVKLVADYLGANKKLMALDICRNGINDDGMKNIADALVRNSSLTALNLSGNFITIKTAEIIVNAILNHPKLVNLAIEIDCEEGEFDEIRKKFLRIPSLKTLNIRILKLDYVMWFPSKSLEIGRVCIDNIFKVVFSAQPNQEYVALAGAEHNLYVVEKACRIANLPENRPKNRYANVIPYDDCVVVLLDSTYINASRISGVDKNGKSVSTAYIATQGPLENTTDDFYRMILEYKVGIIVMLAGVIEGEQVKCHRYWPACRDIYNEVDGVLQPTTLGDREDTIDLYQQSDYTTFGRASRAELAFAGSRKPLSKSKGNTLELNSVVVHGIEETIKGNIIKRVLEVYDINDRELKSPHRVVQYQLKGWPDHGVPNNARLIREIMHMVEEERADETVPRPIVVHCSAGLGRTGTFIAIHQNIIKIKKAVAEGKFDPKNYYINLYQDVLLMRGCRSGMVQQPAQYMFCYKAIAEEVLEMDLVKPPENFNKKEFYVEIQYEPESIPKVRNTRCLAMSSRSALCDSHAEDEDDDFRGPLSVSRTNITMSSLRESTGLPPPNESDSPNTGSPTPNTSGPTLRTTLRATKKGGTYPPLY